MKKKTATVTYDVNGKRFDIVMDVTGVPEEKEAKHIAMESLAKHAIKEDMDNQGLEGHHKLIAITENF
ncbi:MAG: hypothetical protein ACRCX1_08140 [Bacteroidales bacterium]